MIKKFPYNLSLTNDNKPHSCLLKQGGLNQFKSYTELVTI